MKKSLFGIRKTTSTIIATLLIRANNTFTGGIPVIDLNAITNQVKDYAIQLQQYEQMYSQLRQQVQMVQIQKQNLERLIKEDWDNLGTVLYQTRNVINKVNGISYDISNVSRKFEDACKDFEGYSNDPRDTTNESERDKTYSDKYKRIAEANQNTFNGTLQQPELRYQDLESEGAFIVKLKQNLQNSNGDLQAVQATNDPLAYQIDGVKRLGSVIMDQSNMLTNHLVSRNNKQTLEQAEMKKFFQRNKNSNFYQSNSGVSKWE